jgi:hypothetical protein
MKIKANDYCGRVFVCLETESDDNLWQTGERLWGAVVEETPDIHIFESWEEYEHWLAEDVTVEVFSESASELHNKWREEDIDLCKK